MVEATIRGVAKRRAVALGSLSLAVAALVAGCSSPSSATPSKASYDKQADAICKTYSAKENSAASALTSSTTNAQIVSALNKAISLGEEGSKKLQALPKPTGERAALNKAFTAQTALVDQLKKVLQAAKANDAEAFKSAASGLTTMGSSLDQQFDALGLTTCGSGSQ